MKNKSLFFIILLLLANLSFSVPSKISFQGVLKDSGGSPITGTRDITFTIYDASSGGTNLWSETQTVSVESGLYNVQLGSVSAITSSVFTGGDTRYLAMTIGGSELSPRTAILTVPYAFKADRAAYADTAGSSGAAAGTVSMSPLTQQTTDAATGVWIKNTRSGGYSAISVEASGTQAIAVIGAASDTSSDVNAGGFFGAASQQGRGVWGLATSTTGTNYGGYFKSFSTDGMAVYGRAENSTGQNYGGYFRADGDQGIGVYGIGDVVGGSFEATDSTNGIGVYGKGYSVGGYFENIHSPSTINGGIALYTSNFTSGGWFVNGNESVGLAWRYPSLSLYCAGYFVSNTADGIGLYSYAENSSGKSIGIYSKTDAAAGYSGIFDGGKGIVITPAYNGSVTTEEGTIRYDSGDNHFYGWNGSIWKQLDNN